MRLSPDAQEAAATAGLLEHQGGGTITIFGTAPVEIYRAILRGLVYDNTAAVPDTADRSIQIMVVDNSSAVGLTQQRTVEIDAPPVIGGAVVGQTLTDKQTVTPLETMTIADGNTSQQQTVTVQTDPAKGAFTTDSLTAARASPTRAKASTASLARPPRLRRPSANWCSARPRIRSPWARR